MIKWRGYEFLGCCFQSFRVDFVRDPLADIKPIEAFIRATMNKAICGGEALWNGHTAKINSQLGKLP